MITAHFSEKELGVEGCEQRLLDNAADLCTFILEPTREEFGPINIHDGYRDDSHNRRVGGKATSFHLYEDGKAAADIDAPGHTCVEVFNWLRLKSQLPFDKAILEYHDGRAACVHVQIDRFHPPRRQAFIGQTGNGTAYTPAEVI